MHRMLKFAVLLLASIGSAEAFFGLAPPAGPYMDSAGWTVFTPSLGTGTCAGSSGTYTGTCIYYVSEAGTDDTTNCKGYAPPVTASPATTCASFSFAMSQTRSKGTAFPDGRPDWILLKRGESFFPTATTLIQSGKGRSKWEPMVIGAYGAGTDRYIIDMKNNTSKTNFVQHQTSTSSFIAIIDGRFTNSCKDPDHVNYSLDCLGSTGGNMGPFLAGTYLHFENNVWHYVNGPSYNATAMINEIVLRRNSFRNGYPNFNTAQTPSPLPSNGYTPREGGNGTAGSSYQKILVEENLFYEPSTMVSQMTGGTVTITIADPAVIEWTDKGMPPAGMPPEGSVIGIKTSGALPTGLTAVADGFNCTNAQCYYVRNVDTEAKTANLSRFKTGGTLVATTGSQSGTHTAYWVDPQANIFIHNGYLDLAWDASLTAPITLGGMIFRNNISAYAAATGWQSRPGGIYYNNLFLRNPIAFNGTAWPSTISYNVILEGEDMQEGITPQAYGWGLAIVNWTCAAPAAALCPQHYIDAGNLPTPGSPGTVIEHNIFAHLASTGGNGMAIRLYPSSTVEGTGFPFTNPAVTGVTVRNNVICDWPTFNDEPIRDQGSGNTIEDNITNTATDCTTGIDPALPDPTRTAATYYETILGGDPGSTTRDFLDFCWTKWSKVNWEPRCLPAAVNNWIRPGYGVPNP